VKRRRLEEEKQKSDAIAKAEEAKAALRDKFGELDARGALSRILKHLHAPKKFSKCLSMLSRLVSEHFDFLDGTSLFTAFDSVMKFPMKFKDEGDRKQIETLYFKLVELSCQAQEFDEVSLFTDRQTAILDLYYDCVYVQSAAYLDDAFKFNDALRSLESMLASMQVYRDKHDLNKVYYTLPPELSDEKPS